MWDLALDGESGDILFSPTRDLLGATGDGLTRQRILLRCKIPRGSWQYDDDKTLGSRLNTISRFPSSRQINEAPGIVREALEPMDDIVLNDVQVSTTDKNQLLVAVNYSVVDEIDDDSGPDTSGLVEFSTEVTI
jgi:hypothetical protein